MNYHNRNQLVIISEYYSQQLIYGNISKLRGGPKTICHEQLHVHKVFTTIIKEKSLIENTVNYRRANWAPDLTKSA